MSTQAEKIYPPRVIGLAVNLVFLGVARRFFAELESAHAAFQTARVPSFSAHFYQVPVHDPAFTSGAFLSVCLDTGNKHYKLHQLL